MESCLEQVVLNTFTVSNAMLPESARAEANTMNFLISPIPLSSIILITEVYWGGRMIGFIRTQRPWPWRIQTSRSWWNKGPVNQGNHWPDSDLSGQQADPDDADWNPPLIQAEGKGQCSKYGFCRNSGLGHLTRCHAISSSLSEYGKQWSRERFGRKSNHECFR